VIESYEGKELTEVDKKLLKGLNDRKVHENEEGRDKMFSNLKSYLLKKVEEEKKKNE